MAWLGEVLPFDNSKAPFKVVEIQFKELLMNIRYQNGHLRCRTRKNGATSWEFMWREHDSSGKRVRRTSVIGTIEEDPTKELA
jgi:hypothetical protein